MTFAVQLKHTHWAEVLHKLGPVFAARAAADDTNDSFVADMDNWRALGLSQTFTITPTQETEHERPRRDD